MPTTVRSLVVLRSSASTWSPTDTPRARAVCRPTAISSSASGHRPSSIVRSIGSPFSDSIPQIATDWVPFGPTKPICSWKFPTVRSPTSGSSSTIGIASFWNTSPMNG